MAKKSEIKKAKIIYLLGVVLIITINLGHFYYQKNIKKEYFKSLENVYLNSQKNFSVTIIEAKMTESFSNEENYFNELGTKVDIFLKEIKEIDGPRRYQLVQETIISYYQVFGQMAERHNEILLYLNKMRKVNSALEKISTSPNDPRAHLLSQQTNLKEQLVLVKEIIPPKIFQSYHNDLIFVISSLDGALGELIEAVTVKNPQLIAKATDNLNSIQLPDSGPSYNDLYEYILPIREKNQLKLQEELISKRLADK